MCVVSRKCVQPNKCHTSHQSRSIIVIIPDYYQTITLPPSSRDTARGPSAAAAMIRRAVGALPVKDICRHCVCGGGILEGMRGHNAMGSRSTTSEGNLMRYVR